MKALAGMSAKMNKSWSSIDEKKGLRGFKSASQGKKRKKAD